ncbi:hypothetical protein CIW83_18345 [Tissierella sp. P1]|uniref:hypothetical protein n=1 Tax=Tissierella sp. P1 TaxID=1280483 RepID=UPI000BA00754|nr:hypothetical protein [Tissierella sp. P1]OZV10780.1 hypothetical protein CIW83_18345 [Tissierella sp. P1]
MNLICRECYKNKECEYSCTAVQELHKIFNKQNKKDKTTRIRNLRRQLSIREAEPSRKLKNLANKINK